MCLHVLTLCVSFLIPFTKSGTDHSRKKKEKLHLAGYNCFVWVDMWVRVSKMRPIVCRFEYVATSDIYVYINMRIIVMPHSH